MRFDESLKVEAAQLFESTFGISPVGVWSAPGRVNLIGEHTDYTGGFVMPLAIGHRAYIAAGPRADERIRAVAQGFDVQEIDLDDVRLGHPPGWLAYLCGAALMVGGRGWDLALVSDVPIGAGLSSSAAITCATVLAIDELQDATHDRKDLARLAQRVEHEIVGIPCGIMDQTAALRCTRGNVLFMDTRSQECEHIPWPAPETDFALLVTNTNAPHMLVDGQYAERRRLCEEATAILGVASLREATLSDLESHNDQLTADQAACARHVLTENARVLRTRELLLQGRGMDIGPELTASHASLRDDFRVTVPPLDCAVESALSAGALGARMTGGGFGGCTIALVEAAHASVVSRAIDEAFAHEGFTHPEHFLATPSAGAHRE